jgi:hypothetical protein
MKAWIRRIRDYVLGQLTGEETCEPFGSRFNFHLILFCKGRVPDIIFFVTFFW